MLFWIEVLGWVVIAVLVLAGIGIRMEAARKLAAANKVRLLNYPDLFDFTPPARPVSR